MGLSEKPSRYRYDLTQRIDDVAGLVDHLGLKRIHLVVHDWGGAIGFGLATRRPDLIGRIGIMNTAAFYLERIPARIAVCRVPVLGALLVRGLNGFAGPATTMAMHSRSLTPTEKRGYLLPYDSWAHRVAVHRFVRDIPMERNHPTRPVLQQISSRLDLLSDRKMMIVWGRRDFCFDDAFLRHWTEIYPQAEVRRFNDAGHYVLEDAGEAAVNLMADFVR
jgi:haloalkane dehalogenase